MIKGIILSGGSGTRLYPLTKSLSKQILPIYDKPMIYYPLSSLLKLKIKDICIISSNEHINLFKDLLGDGSEFGIKIIYLVQNSPNGIAESFIIAKDFIGNDDVVLILGDNIFFGNWIKKFRKCIPSTNGCLLVSFKVRDPQRYGVAEFNRDRLIKIHEKPTTKISPYAVTGIYFYKNNVVKKALVIKPSARNELEISDINNMYIKEKKCKCLKFSLEEMNWFDAGTFESLLRCQTFVYSYQQRSNELIGSPHIEAIQNKFICKKKLVNCLTNKKIKNEYFNLIKTYENL